jgi:SepF-like predicted cell division protein (DUF552 family)
MPEENTNVMTPEETAAMLETARNFAANAPATVPAETPATPAPRKKRAANKKKATPRTVEELNDVAVSKMTDAEKNMYIAYCRNIIGQKTAQLKNLDETTKKVFDDARNTHNKYDELVARVERDMQLIRSGVTIMAESVINHTYGGK